MNEKIKDTALLAIIYSTYLGIIVRWPKLMAFVSYDQCGEELKFKWRKITVLKRKTIFPTYTL